MKKVLALLLCLMMITGLLAGCGQTDDDADNATSGAAESEEAGSQESETSEDQVEINYDSTITVGVSADIGTMDQFGASSSGVSIKKLLCYETLFYQDENGDLQPLLAKSYTSEGNGTYTVELFDYITDCKGNHMTASDIVFSIDQLKGESTQSDLWATITDYKAVDEYTFQITVDPETTGQVNNILTRVSMITEAGYNSSEDGLATEPIGTGGYVLDTSASITGATYTFVRRDDYWQTDEEYITERNANYLASVVCKVYTDTSTLATGLETGEIDFTSDLETNGLSLFMDGDDPLEGYIRMDGENNSFVHLMFNCSESSPCSDIYLRQAICYAIDAAGCAYNVYGDYGEVCNGPTNPNLEDSSLDYGYDEYFDYDVEKAKELVAQSSYDGETIKILVLPRTTVSASGVLILNYLQAAGITAELLEYDMATYRSKRTEADPEYDIELLGATTGDTYVYTSLKELNASSYSSGISRIMIEDDTLQELYEAVSNQETNSPEAVQELFDYVTDNCYIYGMYYSGKILIGTDNIVSGTVMPFYGPIFSSFVIE